MQDNLEFLRKLKELELAFKAQLVRTGTIQDDTQIKLIPTDKGFTHAVLFISDNNIQLHEGSITMRVSLSRNLDYFSISEKRLQSRQMVFDIGADEAYAVKLIRRFEDVLSTESENLRTYRIRLKNTTLFLSGYNDYINDRTLEKGLFPVWSEHKFKMYSSLEKVVYTLGIMKAEHPNIDAEWTV